MRPIDADKLIKWLNVFVRGYVDLYSIGFVDGIKRAIEGTTELAETPLTYTDLVPHGRWEWYISPVCLSGDVYHRCSICGESDPWQMTTRGCANFCPNCGAKMDVK